MNTNPTTRLYRGDSDTNTEAGYGGLWLTDDRSAATKYAGEDGTVTTWSLNGDHRSVTVAEAMTLTGASHLGALGLSHNVAELAAAGIDIVTCDDDETDCGYEHHSVLVINMTLVARS